jgi:hypothetical protein
MGSRAKLRTKEGGKLENVFVVVSLSASTASAAGMKSEWNVSPNLIELRCRCRKSDASRLSLFHKPLHERVRKVLICDSVQVYIWRHHIWRQLVCLTAI